MFTKQTNAVVEFLGTARQYENATRLEIPKLKHAPTSLTSSLEEYLNDPDFEVNRRQYLAEQDVKKGKKGPVGTTAGSSEVFKKPADSSNPKSNTLPQPTATPTVGHTQKGPAPDLIDFFESIEQNQQPMAVQSQQAPNFQLSQQTGFMPQQAMYNMPGGQQQMLGPQQNGALGNSNPFGQPVQQQQHFSGPSFGPYNSQPFSAASQDSFPTTAQATGASFPSQQQPFSTGQTSVGSSFHTGQSQAQSTNPFRQSMFPQATGNVTPSFQPSAPLPPVQSPQSTNPFARTATMPTSNGQPSNSPFNSPPPQIPQQSSAPYLTPQRTGTNPFAKGDVQSSQTPFSAQPMVSQPTGSTNPFRQSMFVNQQTGQGWTAGQGTMGGMEQMPTVPVFPRGGQQSQPNAWS